MHRILAVFLLIPGWLIAAVLEREVSPDGDAAPLGARFSVGSRVLAHPDSINDIAVSADGRWAATTGADGRLVVFDLVRQRELGRWRGLGFDSAVRFLGADRLAVFSSQGWLVHLALPGGDIVSTRRVLAEGEQAYQVALAADGRICAWGDGADEDAPMDLLVDRDGQRTRIPGKQCAFAPTPASQSDDSNLYGLVFTPDGDGLAALVGNHAAAVIVAVADGSRLRQIHVPELPRGPIFRLAWIDAERIAVQTHDELAIIALEPDSARIVDRAPATANALVVDRSRDDALRVLTTVEWRVLGTWDGTDVTPVPLRREPALPFPRAVWINGAQAVVQWDRQRHAIALADGRMALLPDAEESFMCASSDGRWQIHGGEGGYFVRSATGDTAPTQANLTRAPRLTAEGDLCLINRDHEVLRFPAQPGAPVSTYACGASLDQPFDAHGAGSTIVAVASEPPRLAIWHAAGAARIIQLPADFAHVSNVTCAADGERIAVATARYPTDIERIRARLLVIDRVSGATLFRHEDEGEIRAVQFTPDGRLVFSLGATVVIHDAARVTTTLRRHFADVRALAADNDVVIAACDDGTVVGWPLRDP